VEERRYRKAIDAILDGIDRNSSQINEDNAELDKAFESWPRKFRAEAQRCRPKGQPLLAAIQWPAIFGGYKRELCPQ
jgi:hypothetical protein